MIKKIDLNKVKRVSLFDRPSKVEIDAFSRPLKKPVSFAEYFNSLPDILAGKSIKDLVKSIVIARKRNKPVILSFGAHLIKCGLSPLVNDLMRRGIVTAIATNGASTVHDYELAAAGQTSEDVALRLKNGSFGMTRETGIFLNNAAKKAAIENLGIGSIIGREILAQKLAHRNLSIFANARKLGVPATVHVAIGTDIIYQHPECDGAAWGKASYTDFLGFAESISSLGGGGVYLNFGSAVIMPEIFLKALTISRNLGNKAYNFTTANFDMIRQYRPQENIVFRPTQDSGKGYNFTGHHELMFPLLYAAIIDRMQ